MENIVYPVLFYPLQENAVLGIVLGTELQFIDTDVRGLKSTISEHLQKQYRKTGDYPLMEIAEPKLKTIEVKVRLHYRTDTGAFPTGKTIDVPIHLIYGADEDDEYFECYIPQLDENFYYYDAKQLNPLALHTAQTALNRMSPEEVYRLVQMPVPVMETVTLRVNPDRFWQGPGISGEADYPTLKAYTEVYPYSKSVRKKLSTLPEVAWEIDEQIELVQDKILNSRANVIVCGESGTGKSALLKAVIRKIAGKGANAPLKFRQLRSQRITSAAKYLGEWQQTVEDLMDELQYSNSILWVLDLAQLLAHGGQGAEDSVAAYMNTHLQAGKIQMLGEATPSELESMRRLLPGFVENFQIVNISELPEQKLQNIYTKFVQYSAKNFKVNILPNAIDSAHRLLQRYYPYESSPGKQLRFLSLALSKALDTKKEQVNKDAVLDIISSQTGLPDIFLRDEKLLEEDAMRTYFEQRVIGQPQVVDILCQIVKVYKTGLNNPKRPINVMVFVGPTGVGKTESAKALADYFFGVGQKKTPLIRFDMSEFRYAYQIQRFIGSGKEPGELVKAVRERPFSVLLLDEVEKADLSIFDALMTVLDEGRLTDNLGRTTHFRNTVIILTTNLGASNVKPIGYSGGAAINYNSAISGHFRPEFVNRIDNVISFNSLQPEDIRKITLKELEALHKREGLIRDEIKLKFSEALVNYFASVGFDERYGARPLQRSIEDKLIKALSQFLLKNPTLKGVTLNVDYDEDIFFKIG